MGPFGACNFWRYWRMLTPAYPKKLDREYTEVGAGTKRGVNLMLLVKHGIFLLSIFLLKVRTVYFNCCLLVFFVVVVFLSAYVCLEVWPSFASLQGRYLIRMLLWNFIPCNSPLSASTLPLRQASNLMPRTQKLSKTAKAEVRSFLGTLEGKVFGMCEWQKIVAFLHSESDIYLRSHR